MTKFVTSALGVADAIPSKVTPVVEQAVPAAAHAMQLTNLEFWSLIIALIALIVSLAAIAGGLIWSAVQKSQELRSLRSVRYHEIASWISDASQHSRQIAAVLDMKNYPEFKEASLFLLLQIRNDIVGDGAHRLKAAIDKTVSELAGKKG